MTEALSEAAGRALAEYGACYLGENDKPQHEVMREMADVLRALLAENERLKAELDDSKFNERRLTDIIGRTDRGKERLLQQARDARAGWDAAHKPRQCGHPGVYYLDKNWPASEESYNPKTGECDPPMEYRCLVCEAEARVAELEKALREK